MIYKALFLAMLCLPTYIHCMNENGQQERGRIKKVPKSFNIKAMAVRAEREADLCQDDSELEEYGEFSDVPVEETEEQPDRCLHLKALFDLLFKRS